jgi:DNA-binding XRE family transcriptional regulator
MTNLFDHQSLPCSFCNSESVILPVNKSESNLSLALIIKDMSQVEMAKFLGITKSTLCDIEKGRQAVTPAVAAKIAKKCGLSVVIAVETAINDQLRRAGLKMSVKAS